MSGPPVVNGRPDFADRRFGVTLAKRFAPYAYARGPNAALVHRVVRVELRWYDVGPCGHTLVRRATPKATAVLACGPVLYLATGATGPEARKRRALLCALPAPGAVLCGRCHGEPASFGPYGSATRTGLSKRAAGARLGCLAEGTEFGV